MDVAKKIPKRINELEAFTSLNDVPSSKPFKKHKLKGKFKDCYAINITQQYRLIFRPNDIKEIDLKKIKKIIIMEVSKHYE